MHQYYQFVKDAYKDYIYPTIRYADLIVPGSRNNKVSVEFIVRHMKNMTREMYAIHHSASSTVALSTPKYTSMVRFSRISYGTNRHRTVSFRR